jgi:hypothetical protein
VRADLVRPAARLAELGEGHARPRIRAGLREHGLDEIAGRRFGTRDPKELVLGRRHRTDERVAVPLEVFERQHAGSAARRRCDRGQRTRAAGRTERGADVGTPGLEVGDLRAQGVPGGTLVAVAVGRAGRRVLATWCTGAR